MSPIKNVEHYPPKAEWNRIREHVLARAEHRCECLGECGVRHGDPLDYPIVPVEWTRPATWRCEEEHGEPGVNMRGRVVLTIAHLDHDASAGNHTPENLKAMCQACHLRYDNNHRRAKDRSERNV